MTMRSVSSGAVTIWRLIATRYANDAFDGEGARLFGGRWNFTGTPLVYSSQTLSLAAMELFVNLGTDCMPEGLSAVAATVPADVRLLELDPAALPAEWRAYPTPEGVKRIGTQWAASGKSLGLWVPSAVIPSERNLLLNPRHPELSRLEIAEAKPFSFDPRMWKSTG